MSLCFSPLVGFCPVESMATSAIPVTFTRGGTIHAEEDEGFVEYILVKKCRAMEAQKILQRKGRFSSSAAAIPSSSDDPTASIPPQEAKPSLLFKASQLKRDLSEITPTEQLFQQEKEMIEHLSGRKTLMSVCGLAKGITYSEPIPTGWKPPTSIRRMSSRQADAIYRQWHILVEGEDIPLPIKNFKDIRLPELILRKLKEKGIIQSMPIQV